MEKRRFAGIDRPASLLGFGLMRLPLLNNAAKDIDYPLAEQMIAQAIDAGVSYFDTAWPYHEGESELFAGAALSRYPRDSYCLATKLPTWDIQSADDVHRIFAEQLKRCRVEYFDFYLIHALNKDYYKIALDVGIYEILREKKEQGLIRHLGFSFHDHADLLENIVSSHDWDFAQIQLNYVDWLTTDAKRQYEILEARKIPAVIMEPLRGGALASLNPEATAILTKADPAASPASWGLRYAASLPGVMTVLSGMSTLEQTEDNLKTMKDFRPLTDAEQATIAKAAEAYLASGTIPCTGCRYCMDCPEGVDIPRVFAIYNHYLTLQNDPYGRALFNNNYRSLDSAQHAHNCIACGVCMEHCPQGIQIPDHMTEIAAFAAS